MINSRRYVPNCNIGSDDGWILSGRLFHLRWARGTTVASQINQINIVATARDVIHPRETIQRQIECTARRLRGTVHIEKRLLPTELGHAFGADRKSTRLNSSHT